MRAYIIADMVGSCGIWRRKQLKVGSREWSVARQAFTQDVNAAIEAFQRLGYPEIILKDIHGCGMNLKRSVLVPRARYEPGIFLEPVPILGKMQWANCAVLLGCHARAGAEEGFYPHTFLDGIDDITVNGRPVGESDLLAGALGELGIPVTCAAGERLAVSHLKQTIPWIETLEIPKDRPSNIQNRDGATQLIRKRNEIRALVERACKPKATFQKFEFEKPVHFTVTFRSADRARFYNSWGLQQVDNQVSWQTPTFLDGFRQLIHLFYVPRPMAGVAASLYRTTNFINRAIYSVF